MPVRKACRVTFHPWCPLLLSMVWVQARDELIDTLCKKEMGVYTAIFSSTGDTAVRPALRISDSTCAKIA